MHDFEQCYFSLFQIFHRHVDSSHQNFNKNQQHQKKLKNKHFSTNFLPRPAVTIKIMIIFSIFKIFSRIFKQMIEKCTIIKANLSLPKIFLSRKLVQFLIKLSLRQSISKQRQACFQTNNKSSTLELSRDRSTGTPGVHACQTRAQSRWISGLHGSCATITDQRISNLRPTRNPLF